MFLQDRNNPPDVFFCNKDRPRPSQDVTDMYVIIVFRKIQCTHRLNWGIRSFMPTMYVLNTHIDIDQLKGKPIQNLVKIYFVVQEIYMSSFTNCYYCCAHLHVVQ